MANGMIRSSSQWWAMSRDAPENAAKLPYTAGCFGVTKSELMSSSETAGGVMHHRDVVSGRKPPPDAHPGHRLLVAADLRFTAVQYQVHKVASI
jgi:hypothetical protein